MKVKNKINAFLSLNKNYSSIANTKEEVKLGNVPNASRSESCAVLAKSQTALRRNMQLVVWRC